MTELTTSVPKICSAPNCNQEISATTFVDDKRRQFCSVECLILDGDLAGQDAAKDARIKALEETIRMLLSDAVQYKIPTSGPIKYICNFCGLSSTETDTRKRSHGVGCQALKARAALTEGEG